MNDFVQRFFKTGDNRAEEPEAAYAAEQALVDDDPAAEENPQFEATAPATAEADQAAIEFGDEVAAILATAKQAAQKLHDSTRQDADRIREEAEEVRAEAEAYSKSTREEADLHAVETRRKLDVELEERRRDAEHEANEIRRAAKQRAEELASEALRRRGAIIAEAERSEARLEQLLDVFRTVTSQLEELLGSERGVVSSGETHNLDEALRPRTLGPPG